MSPPTEVTANPVAIPGTSKRFRSLGVETFLLQIITHHLLRYHHMRPPLFVQRHDAFPANGGDMSFKVANAGLAGVVVDNFQDGILHKGNFVTPRDDAT
jgi:hypothetical protein